MKSKTATFVAAALLLPLAASCAEQPGQEAFCNRARRFSEQYDQQDPSNEEAIAGIQSLVDVAPSEIKEDAEILLEFVRAVAADESGSLPDVTEASANFSEYLTQVCGIPS